MKSKGFGLGLAKGLQLTLKHIPRRRITTRYPERRLAPAKRFRGWEFAWDVKLCTGCLTCAKNCPQGSIKIVTHPTEDNEYWVDEFVIDTGHCQFCGLCVEVCPYGALSMGSRYEGAKYRRQELLVGARELIEMERQPSAFARPWFEEEREEQTLLVYGDTEKE